MKAWTRPRRPAEIAEERLLQAITSGRFAVNSPLPAERELAEQIGVTRPTLREALQRLARDGWLDIQQGKPTRVRDYLMEGNLAVLAMLAQASTRGSAEFVPHLLELRVLLAPAYTRQALENSRREVVDLLAGYSALEDKPEVFARADWELHALLTHRASNPIFRLLLNSFQDLYQVMGSHYFVSKKNRDSSRLYYRDLLAFARKGSIAKAEALTRQVMQDALARWKPSS
jgi:GntR family negative regulator for fad regulon and positive regulator of fabA